MLIDVDLELSGAQRTWLQVNIPTPILKECIALDEDGNIANTENIDPETLIPNILIELQSAKLKLQERINTAKSGDPDCAEYANNFTKIKGYETQLMRLLSGLSFHSDPTKRTAQLPSMLLNALLERKGEIRFPYHPSLRIIRGQQVPLSADTLKSALYSNGYNDDSELIMATASGPMYLFLSMDGILLG